MELLTAVASLIAIVVERLAAGEATVRPALTD
jgi:hypothetical protein